VIELYFWTTSNGYKVRLMIEEVGVPYNLHPIDIQKNEQRSPEYLAISPGHKIPALIDPDGPDGRKVSLFESGPIIQYLANKSNSPLYPDDPIQRLLVDQWFFFGAASFAPISQQLVVFMHRFPEDVPPAKNHYRGLVRDIYATLDRRLATNEYLAGDYSLADIGNVTHAHQYEWLEIDLAEYPNLARWHDTIWARPAIERAYSPI
jgi:GST-like protein